MKSTTKKVTRCCSWYDKNSIRDAPPPLFWSFMNACCRKNECGSLCWCWVAAGRFFLVFQKKVKLYVCKNILLISSRLGVPTREASMQLSNGGHIGMASKSQICEFLHQDLNFGAFFIVLNIYFIFFIINSYEAMWYSGKYSCLGSRRPGFNSHYCKKSFFSFKSWRRNSKICDQDAISIWLPLNSCVDASLVAIAPSSSSYKFMFVGFLHRWLRPVTLTLYT